MSNTAYSTLHWNETKETALSEGASVCLTGVWRVAPKDTSGHMSVTYTHVVNISISEFSESSHDPINFWNSSFTSTSNPNNNPGRQTYATSPFPSYLLSYDTATVCLGKNRVDFSTLRSVKFLALTNWSLYQANCCHRSSCRFLETTYVRLSELRLAHNLDGDRIRDSRFRFKRSAQFVRRWMYMDSLRYT